MSDADHALLSAYKEADRDVRVRYSAVGCALALTLMPAGVLLDYFVYPELLWPFFQIRVLSVVVLGALFGLHFLTVARSYIRVLSMSWGMAVQVAICAMIALSEGAHSPYYAGLNCVILAIAVLSPWTFGETLIACILTVGAYVAACFINPSQIHTGEIFNNLYFLAMTDIICVASTYFAARGRFNEFRLRHELDLKNREIESSYKKLSELDRLKSDFFANISHELRTPLTLIIAPIEDLLRRDSGLSGPVRETLTIAQHNALRLLKLINDLLELVRLEEKAVVLHREKVDLGIYLPAMADSVRHLATAKGLELVVQPPVQPVLIHADPGRMEKIILNILSNAIKFTPQGGRITTHWDRNDSMAWIEIADTGVGIAESELPFIFDRFRQADSSSTRKYQGVGIGLALARDLVKEHGGRLTAASEVGRGTTLRVEFPLTAPAQEEPPPMDTQTPGAGGADPIAEIYQQADRLPAETPPARDSAAELNSIENPGATVLVVDDEPDMRRFLVSVLSREHRVLEAVDGRQALDLARVEKPALILLDLMLPEIDGLGVCAQLKGDASTRDMKIILLTARTDEASKLTALRHGADDFLVKPFSTTEVQMRIRNLLQTASLEVGLRQRNADLQKAMNQLKETEAQLVHSEKINALGKLSAGLLHEINNPLNFTLTALQLAEDSAPENDADLKETLNDIGDGMRRIRDIVSDLRTFAYPTAAHQRERFALCKALDSAMRMAAHELKDAKVVREALVDASVSGSSTQITHVFLNLLVNSAQAVRKPVAGRKPTIQVASEVLGDKLRVRVWDNGTGIKAEDLPRVFDPFFTTRPVGEGVGLGLSICHTIIKNHNGNIHARSEEGQWTEVEFELPLATGEKQ